MSPDGAPINDFDCPLLEMEHTITMIRVATIIHVINIVHECTASCIFKASTKQHTVERQEVLKNTLTYYHDYHNNFFSLNLYAMKM